MIESIGYPTSTVAIFLTMVVAMLFIDFWNHRESKEVSMSSAVKWSIFYVACAIAFGLYLKIAYSSEVASLFMTGYVLEKVLAFDNLFVFTMIFAYFNIQKSDEHHALYWGIGGAIVFRLIFVVAGVSFMELIGSTVEIIFATIILYTVWVMYNSDDDDTEDYDNSWYVKGIRKIYPKATPFVLAIVTIEISDILFSFDSVPAVIAVTKDPLLIYSAMIFAILGLRSMYHIISAMLKHFQYLDQAVMCILVFIAGKLLVNGALDIHMNPVHSLLVVIGILITGIIVSLLKEKKNA